MANWQGRQSRDSQHDGQQHQWPGWGDQRWQGVTSELQPTDTDLNQRVRQAYHQQDGWHSWQGWHEHDAHDKIDDGDDDLHSDASTKASTHQDEKVCQPWGDWGKNPSGKREEPWLMLLTYA